MVPGALAGDVDAILRDGILAAGLRKTYDNISGYTLGHYHLAGPRTSDFTRIFHPGAGWELEAGWCSTCTHRRPARRSARPST
jgi:Xaa-Pro dipeptidase